MTTPAPSLPAWAPSPQDVGNIIARLIPDQTGQTTGLFTSNTIPTVTQVQQIIASVCAEVALLAPSVPDAAAAMASRAAAFGAAVQIASSFFPELPSGYLVDLRTDYLDAQSFFIIAADRALGQQAGAQAVNRLHIHNARPLPPMINDFYAPYTDPYWPY